MRCYDTDRVRPLDELLGDTTGEFGSGRDRVCDKDLDAMIWELGDYENEEPPQDAEEYEGETPIEDELVEKTMTVNRKGRVSFKEVPEDEDLLLAGETLAVAGSIGTEARKKRPAAVKSISTMRSAKAAPKNAATAGRVKAAAKKAATARGGKVTLPKTAAAHKQAAATRGTKTPPKKNAAARGTEAAATARKTAAARKAKPGRRAAASRTSGSKEVAVSRSKRSGR